MNNAASFNLLKFVEQRSWLSVRKIVLAIILYTVLLLAYFLLQVYQIRHSAEASSKMQLIIQQSVLQLQPLLSKGTENPLIGVWPAGALQNDRGFYPEFEALTHIQVKGLWLNRVIIQRNPPFIKIIGAMDSPDKLSQLLKQLAAQSAFKDSRFIGVDVSQGLLPNVPDQYKNELSQLKLPMFYHFVIQTTVLQHVQN